MQPLPKGNSHEYRAGDHIPNTHRDDPPPPQARLSTAELYAVATDERAVREILNILRTRVESINDLRKVFKRFDADGRGQQRFEPKTSPHFLSSSYAAAAACRCLPAWTTL